MSKISPLACIDPEAKIGDNCEIGPFCFIDKNVVIGDNNVLMNSVTVLYGSRIGNGNTIFPGAVIGAIPQDLKFRGEETTAEIGDNNRIRENVTINRGTAAKGKTVIGNNNLLMEGMHVAHDCIIGNGCIIGNQTKLAGEVEIDDNAILSAVVLVHQFTKIGGYSMLQGGCRTGNDVPPYVIIGREPAKYCGLNIVGLRRRGFSNETIDQIHNAYRIIYSCGLNTKDAIEKIRAEMEMTPEIQYIVNFIENAQRGLIR
ncbi:MAG: acyl-ACP--UDP-N-acetylglucosamine O-acyltransferase [Bacteroidaceae bacterium]|nr:acyl-ACP--UDP-N-acetylglucosamine O-acyltransferase [Bacteroidaceae bacterium]MCF0186198.1 acyl-ACP--UDP-N-acetylglucosamine O-acyltransferase [Bacteroidaceae bacterium]